MAIPKLPMRDVQVKTVGSIVQKDMLGRSKKASNRPVMKRGSGRRGRR